MITFTDLAILAVAFAIWYHARTLRGIAGSQIKHAYFKEILTFALQIGAKAAKSRIRGDHKRQFGKTNGAIKSGIE